MITITIYAYKETEAATQSEKLIKSSAGDIPVRIIYIDLNADKGMAEFLGKEAPMVQVGPYRLKSPLTERDLRVAIRAAHERNEKLKEDPAYQARITRGRTITKTDRLNQWLTKNYMILFILILVLYAGGSILAPVLMKVGAEMPARVLYTIYKPFCHQLAFRSFFLYGEQLYYPRELAGIDGVITYDELIASGVISGNIDLLDARAFLGNDYVGYKIALCQRCLAIYVAMLLVSIIFAATGNRIKPIAWYVWILVGMVPIGLDGGSQIPGALGISLPEWMIIRESTPVFRVVTGALFGIMTFWYLLPQVEDSMRESRLNLSKKFAYAEAEGDAAE
jgi:uncharacterized membrane protein